VHVDDSARHPVPDPPHGEKREMRRLRGGGGRPAGFLSPDVRCPPVRLIVFSFEGRLLESVSLRFFVSHGFERGLAFVASL